MTPVTICVSPFPKKPKQEERPSGVVGQCGGLYVRDNAGASTHIPKFMERKQLSSQLVKLPNVCVK